MTSFPAIHWICTEPFRLLRTFSRTLLCLTVGWLSSSNVCRSAICMQFTECTQTNIPHFVFAKFNVKFICNSTQCKWEFRIFFSARANNTFSNILSASSSDRKTYVLRRSHEWQGNNCSRRPTACNNDSTAVSCFIIFITPTSRSYQINDRPWADQSATKPIWLLNARLNRLIKAGRLLSSFVADWPTLMQQGARYEK